jgi:hypothetical protein
MPTQNPFERSTVYKDTKSLRKALGGYYVFDFLHSSSSNIFKKYNNILDGDFDNKLNQLDNKIFSLEGKFLFGEGLVLNKIKTWFNKFSDQFPAFRSKIAITVEKFKVSFSSVLDKINAWNPPKLPALWHKKEHITQSVTSATPITAVTVLPKENLPAISTVQTIIPKDIYRILRRLQTGLVLVVVILIFQTFLILNKGLNIQIPGATSQAQNLQTVSTLPTTSTPGNRVVTDFNTNLGIVDVGSSLKVQKAEIDLRNVSNCSTPLVPPLQNGCGFSILPSALGIPNRGVLFKNIQFQGSLGDGGKIALDLKDYDKGELGNQIATIDKSTFDQKTILPQNIDSTSGIFVRLWSTGGNDIVINSILVEYDDVSNLRPVSGKISTDLAKENVTATIYEDRDENKLLDPDIDQKWSCRPNFSGVAQIKFNADGNFTLQRDDDCFIDVKPDSWYTDEKKDVLPPGKWLMVIDGKNLVFNFEIQPDDKQVILDFTK